MPDDSFRGHQAALPSKPGGRPMRWRRRWGDNRADAVKVCSDACRRAKARGG